MKKQIAISSSLLLVILMCFSGVAKSQDILKWNIERANLKDTFLIEQIRKLITEETQFDSVFRKKGYINVYINSFSNLDTLRAYFIDTNYDDKVTNDGKILYPHFYTIISGRLVCYYIKILTEDVSMQFSAKSVRKFSKILSKHISPKDELNTLFKMHGGKLIYIIKNKKPVVVSSTY